MIRVPVATPSRSYEVLIGSGLLARAGECLGRFLETRRAFVVTAPPVRRRWASFCCSRSPLRELKRASWKCPTASAPNVFPPLRISRKAGQAGSRSRSHPDRSRRRRSRRRNRIPRLHLYARRRRNPNPNHRAGPGRCCDRGKTGVNLVSGKICWVRFISRAPFWSTHPCLRPCRRANTTPGFMRR